MAFKPSKMRAPASPSVYKVETDNLFGIDTTTSDDNISLSRACGTSYFDVEQNGGNIQPGMCNFIRTRYGEIGKRRGSKEVSVQWMYGPEEIYMKKSVAGLVVLITRAKIIDSDDKYNIVFLIYKDGEYVDKTINLHDDFVGEYKTITINEKVCVIFCENGVIFVDVKSLTSDSGIKAFALSGSKIYNCVSTANEQYYVMVERDWESEIWATDFSIYIPVIYIAASPKGGNGQAYEPVNLLCPWVEETFIADGSSTKFYPSLGYGGAAMLFYLDDEGNWINRTGSIIEDTIAGEWYIHSSETIPKPTVAGEPNVRIIYLRAGFSIPTTITNCTLSCNFGVGGYKDRLFISGNPEHPNRVWYSEMDDYSYFSDVGYIDFSDSACTIKAMSGHDTSLAVITDDNCYLVGASINTNSLTADTHDAAFVVSHVFESAKPAGYPAPFVFNNEVVYMSRHGLATITPSNVMDERYVQLRSERINAWLLNEELEGLQCCVCGDFFVINNGNGRIYLLDGTMFSSTASKPFSHRQYEGYIWELEADYVWEQAGELHFLYNDKIYRILFTMDAENEDYIDEHTDSAIKCYWETPNIYGTDFYVKKSFTKLAVLLRKSINGNDKTEVNTTVRVWAKRDQQPWKLVKDYDGEQSVFRYDYLNYGLFSYRSSGKRYAIDKKIKFKKTYGLKLRFENDLEGIPCYLQSFGVEYCK